MTFPASYVGRTRACSACGEEKSFPYMFRKKSKQCVNCYSAKRRIIQAKTRAAERERLRSARQTAQVQARQANAHAVPLNTRRFEVSLSLLEASWGPYAKWTPEQHLQHSTWLRRAAGIAESDGLTRRSA